MMARVMAVGFLVQILLGPSAASAWVELSAGMDPGWLASPGRPSWSDDRRRLTAGGNWERGGSEAILPPRIRFEQIPPSKVDPGPLSVSRLQAERYELQRLYMPGMKREAIDPGRLSRDTYGPAPVQFNNLTFNSLWANRIDPGRIQLKPVEFRPIDPGRMPAEASSRVADSPIFLPGSLPRDRAVAPGTRPRPTTLRRPLDW